MDLENSSCYRAFESRDARFDGRFFVGVRTTGIYCRPVCPARHPRPENVRFYACAAAAEEAGFRPCRRCRPETAPGTPAWAGTSATVSRALRLIEEGGLEGRDVGALAERLGVGERHLRRLFARHVGASPLAVARTRRAHFARRLIDETGLPMARVAEGAGYASLRQFNHDIRRTFGAPPTALRRKSVSPGAGSVGDGLRLRLPYRPPLDWEAFLGYLGPRATAGVEAVQEGTYRRTIRVGKAAGWIQVEPDDASHLLLTVHVSGSPELIRIVERVRRIFDLGADPRQIGEHLRRDPTLAALVAARPGLRVPGAWDGFELGVRAILGQQVSVRGATTLAGRLVRRCGEPLGGEAPEGLTHLFPRPEKLARADLSSIGMPGARVEAIRTLARAVVRGRVRLDGALELEEALDRIRALPGLGPWTAGYVAMRGLSEPDGFPYGDLGLRRAVSTDGRPVSSATLDRMADAWRPWRAYAAIHLWSAETASPGKEVRHASVNR